MSTKTLSVGSRNKVAEQRELKELMAYGKELGKKIGYESEEEVAEYFTNLRRQREPWRKNVAKFRNS